VLPFCINLVRIECIPFVLYILHLPVKSSPSSYYYFFRCRRVSMIVFQEVWPITKLITSSYVIYAPLQLCPWDISRAVMKCYLISHS